MMMCCNVVAAWPPFSLSFCASAWPCAAGWPWMEDEPLAWDPDSATGEQITQDHMAATVRAAIVHCSAESKSAAHGGSWQPQCVQQLCIACSKVCISCSLQASSQCCVSCHVSPERKGKLRVQPAALKSVLVV